jgi:uncharacterized protein YjiS (DUF1127 family)
MAAMQHHHLSNRLGRLSFGRNSNDMPTERHEVDLDMNIARSLTEWRRFRETRYQLNQLSSRELEDIGYNRADIVDVARRAARG